MKNDLTESGECAKPMDKTESTSHDENKRNDTQSETKNINLLKRAKIYINMT